MRTIVLINMEIICMCRLDAALNADIKAIKDFIDSQSYGRLTESISQRYYENDVANDFTAKAIQRIRCSNAIYDTIMKGWGNNRRFTHVVEMNEMYSSRVSGVGSGVVVTIKTDDGYFKFIPYITMVYCIITIYNEIDIKPVRRGREPGGLFGEFLVNDYNYTREFSLVKQLPYQQKYTLKLHYIVYPHWVCDIFVGFYKLANIYTKVIARKLFGRSIYSKNSYVNIY